MKIVDLSHPLTNDLPCYPGDQPFVLETAVSGNVTVSKMMTSLHVGTHIDVPLHMLKNQETLDSFSLDRFMGQAQVIEDTSPSSLDTIEEGDIVLLRTGYSKRFYYPNYYQDFPRLNEAFVDCLIEKKIKMLGLDTPSPDDAPYPIHQKLLSKGIFIIENLTQLEELPLKTRFMFYGVPLKMVAEASLIRAFAVL